MMNYFNQESERLRFRGLTEEDIPAWTAFFVANDLLAYLGIDLSKGNAVLAEEWIRMQFGRYENQGLGHLAVERKDTGAFIGMGGLLPRDLNGKLEYEIAYSLKPEYWGHGYGTEIATTMKQYGDQHIDAHRFISIIHIENSASARVAKKNGMAVLFTTEYLGMPVEVYGVANQGLQKRMR